MLDLMAIRRLKTRGTPGCKRNWLTVGKRCFRAFSCRPLAPLHLFISSVWMPLCGQAAVTSSGCNTCQYLAVEDGQQWIRVAIRSGTDLLFLAPCSSILRKGLSSVVELKHAVCIRSFLRWCISCVDIHNCEDVPQCFWSAAIDFVMNRQCPLPAVTNKKSPSGLWTATFLLFFLFSPAWLVMRSSKSKSSPRRTSLTFFPSSHCCLCAHSSYFSSSCLFSLLSFQFCVRRNTEWDDCLIFYHSNLSACSFCVHINLAVSLLNFSLPDCSLSRLFINHSRPSGGGVLRSTSSSPLLPLKAFIETLIISHLLAFWLSLACCAAHPIPHTAAWNLLPAVWTRLLSYLMSDDLQTTLYHFQALAYFCCLCFLVFISSLSFFA